MNIVHTAACLGKAKRPPRDDRATAAFDLGAARLRRSRVASESSSSCVSAAPVTSLGDVRVANNAALHGKRRLSSWFEAWRASLRRWLSGRSSVPSADLDAVAQEVFDRLTRYSDQTLAEYPQSYLFHIAANVVDEWHERAGNSRPAEDAWLKLLQRESDQAASYAEHTLVNEQLKDAVSKLPSRQRDVLMLHINEDLTYKQIASRLKLTPRIVRRDIARAYAQLRCELRVVELDVISSV